MNRLSILFAIAALLPVSATADDRYDDRYGYDDRDSRGAWVDCHSNDRRTQFCGVDTRGGVRLVRQVSSAACIEGRTWGYDRRGIWVANGCRATFEIGDRYGYGYGGPGHGRPARLVRCESIKNRPRFCAVPGGVRRADIQRRLSRAGCEFNYSWGYERDGIWVERGCRADFRVW